VTTITTRITIAVGITSVEALLTATVGAIGDDETTIAMGRGRKSRNQGSR